MIYEIYVHTDSEIYLNFLMRRIILLHALVHIWGNRIMNFRYKINLEMIP
jgi:hypothetical protein